MRISRKLLVFCLALFLGLGALAVVSTYAEGPPLVHMINVVNEEAEPDNCFSTCPMFVVGEVNGIPVRCTLAGCVIDNCFYSCP